MSAASPVPPRDPREIITEDVFRLDPALLGTPLARPWRRAVAMAIDLLLVAVLASAPAVLFGMAAAAVLFRASARPAAGGALRRSLRGVLRFGAAVALFAAVVGVWGSIGDRLRGGPADGPVRVEVDGEDGEVAMTGMQGVRAATELLRFRQADDEAEARRIAEEVVAALRAAGVPERDIGETLSGLAASADRPWLAAAADSALAGLRIGEEPAARLSGDSLLVAYSAAVAAGDTARVAELRRLLAAELARDTISTLRADLAEARAAAGRLEERVDELEEGGGILGLLRTLADDLGLGFGWSGLYFTAFVALWQGRTPGKRLLRVRVIRLDGKPIGWWAAFERFGGYAASLATGLLGFVQILWDRNRQGIHDKITETVVIDDRGAARG